MINIVKELERRLSVVDFNTDLAVEKGLIGPTYWYMRHRDERAQQRIYSSKRSSEEKRETNPKEEIDINTKLKLLKEKLLEKQKNKLINV